MSDAAPRPKGGSALKTLFTPTRTVVPPSQFFPVNSRAMLALLSQESFTMRKPLAEMSGLAATVVRRKLS